MCCGHALANGCSPISYALGRAVGSFHGPAVEAGLKLPKSVTESREFPNYTAHMK
jgi:hypothetical protein